MPRTIESLKNAKRNPKRKGGKKIDFKPIAKKIIESGQYWSVKEVHEKLVQKKVSRFRTMKLLQNQVKGGRMAFYEQDGKYWYGRVPPRSQ